MKVAILISGYLRTFIHNIPAFKAKLINKFDNADIYMHVTNNESRDDKYYNTSNTENDILHIKQLLAPRVFIEEDNITHFESKEKNTVYNLWSKYHKLNNLKKINEKIDGQYDLVIKYRPDLNIISENIFNNFINKEDMVYLPSKSMVDKSKLLSPDDPHICDIFAFGSSAVMDKYFDIFKSIDELMKKYGQVPETLLYRYLNDNNVPYKPIDIDYNVILSTCNVFAICGDSGSGKTTLSNILKPYFSNSFTLECDRYHRWERDDTNWSKYTHLHPEANYIAKMNKDIFDLKIGKTIYQVDYDHKIGKFTEKQQINKADNVIVCGLHSLYNNKGIYNLKIFVDTDDSLKKKWKMHRDMIERGYTAGKSSEQIKNRQADYFKYVYPQRVLSDIVISFYTEPPLAVDSIDQEYRLCLRLYVNKKHPISDILRELNMNSIEYTLDSASDNTFNIVTFQDFRDTNLLKGSLKQGNFYDYIVFFILSLKTRVDVQQ